MCDKTKFTYRSGSKNMAKILVVDDSPTILAGTTKIITSGGHDVIQAESGAQAIEKATSDNPDVIIMDVVMPDMNGFQATRKLTSTPETQHIPVIMLTTKDQETDKVWAKRQGASDYIVKPPEPDDLLAKINSLINS